MTTVIGVDPGLAETGIGIVQGKGFQINRFAFDTLRTSAGSSLPDRLHWIYSRCLEILENQKPDMMIIEDIFLLEKYPKSAISLGKVCGVILLAGSFFKIPVYEIPVREAKQILTGNGNASKMQFERSVRNMLQLSQPIKPDHASDALGLALIGLLRYDLKR
ncbi:MAG TPA: crossover junction endodeoxyribonuclease RuvC [Desulfatirhabdiaceae bacterium]|nr:crossover junction endodeoxyribonuclease RuvC [Desulfatirhabdiaceae bacterium]